MLISFDEFIDRWLGKQLEVHGSANAKYQCVDLSNGFLRDVLGVSIVPWTNAKDFPERIDQFNPNLFQFIKNTPEVIPNRGDLAVWNGNVGFGAGHISVVMKGNLYNFTSFDQNWSKPLYCTIEVHTYQNVRGFLRLKGSTPPQLNPDTNMDYKKEFEKILTHIGSDSADGVNAKWDQEQHFLETERKNVKKLNDLVSKLEKRLLDSGNSNNDSNTKINLNGMRIKTIILEKE